MIYHNSIQRSNPGRAHLVEDLARLHLRRVQRLISHHVDLLDVFDFSIQRVAAREHVLLLDFRELVESVPGNPGSLLRELRLHSVVVVVLDLLHLSLFRALKWHVS